ncbi:DUF2891 domain-containing protein [Sphingomonas sp. G-3-2-10]|uniref:DUF2891 domain-containing protein n=1 Tax=Sphingomonas sp. G-3-2-10 TaxID=2728838 RepID=UPI00146C76D0|nr:DUF2891 domain-containing protein [Sphingomonas sp. G-3-2-10]NML05165.1 DUF2891 domain-containing protein [Sphingomonas sp. G-3-2-10]
MTTLTPEIAGTFARLTLSHLEQQYPYKMDLVLNGPEDAKPPIEHHPIFHGSFDWHSCVHGWWQVMRLLRRYPDLPEAAEIQTRANRMLTPDKVAGELAFLSRPMSAGFERPYGWGWLLALHSELARHDAPWAEALEPLARAFAARFRDFLPKLTYPIRVGTHFNTAFALILARDWAADHDPELVPLIEARALDWFARDRDCQAWEPGGDEFQSPALIEALLMSRVLSAPAFASWFDAFLPRCAQSEPLTLFTPAHVSDRDDGKIAHLDGLNLSRAWCWRGLAAKLGPAHPASDVARAAADRHLEASLGHLDDSYMGSHWLATFALLAIDHG